MSINAVFLSCISHNQAISIDRRWIGGQACQQYRLKTCVSGTGVYCLAVQMIFSKMTKTTKTALRGKVCC